MTKVQDTILQLIRRAIDPKAPVCIPQDVNWDSVIELTAKQGALGFCFDTLEPMRLVQVPEYMPDIDNLIDWLGQESYMETCYEEHRKSIASLAKFYDENGMGMACLSIGLSLSIDLLVTSIYILDICGSMPIRWCRISWVSR